MTRYLHQQICSELLAVLLENPHESLILVDKDAVVCYLSTPAAEFYEVDSREMIGKHIFELNPESKLPRVLKTGKAEIGQVFLMRGKERIIARIPLRGREGNIVGAMGKLMFWHVDRVRELVRQTEVLEERLTYYEKELQNIYSSRYDLKLVVGESPLLQEAKRVASQAAGSDLSLLITGETGTGKDVFAHAVHRMGSRGKRPIVKVNCGAIPQELFESELFGYEAGAFTGARNRGKPGKFELADGGTIFLDEVGDLPMPLQVKLLRVIQDREVERLGGTKALKLDFRVITATNRDLKAMMKKGDFRQDLYYRLNIFHLEVPPLRAIREDIPRIAYHILSGLRTGKRAIPSRISREAMERMMGYSWPGNVRELKNAIDRAAAVAGSGPLLEEHLPPDLLAGNIDAEISLGPPRSLREELAAVEKRTIERALKMTEGNRKRAAGLLDIHRTGLYQKMRRHGIV